MISTIKLLGFLFISALISPLLSQQSINITFNHDGKIVYGTFLKPQGDGPFPTIIINPGSGPNDRDGTLPMTGGNIDCLYPELLGDTLKPYFDMSMALADSGYAVLRYDKLEYTYPTDLAPVTFHKLWLPVESAIDYIKDRQDVDTNQIILLGHSEGSSIIPFIARERKDVRALISIAGPRTPLDSLLAYQIQFIASKCGLDTLTAQFQANQILAYFSFIRSNMWDAGTPPLFGVPASAWYDYVLATDPVAENYNAAELPALFIGFDKDINVPPSELERLEEEINITDDFWSIANHIHFMTPVDDPMVSETLTDTIIYWLRQHGLVSGLSQESPENPDISIFPNPCKSTITIRSEVSIVDPVSIAIKNLHGQTLWFEETVLSSNSFIRNINVEKLPAGIYFLNINKGIHLEVIKIIKL